MAQTLGSARLEAGERVTDGLEGLDSSGLTDGFRAGWGGNKRMLEDMEQNVRGKESDP